MEKMHFEEKKGEYKNFKNIKYLYLLKKIYKMQCLEFSGAVRPL